VKGRRLSSRSPSQGGRLAALVRARKALVPPASGGLSWARIFWGVTFVAVGLGLLWVLRPVLAILAASAGLAYILDPMVDWFERRGIDRENGILVIFGGVTLASALTVLLFIPALAGQLEQLDDRLKPLVMDLDLRIAPALAFFETHTGYRLAIDLDALRERAPALINEHLPSIQGYASGLVRGLFTQGLGLVSALVNLLLLPVFVFYLLRDWDRIVASIAGLIPGRYRPRVDRIAREVDDRLGAFIRGQLTVCAALAGLYTAGLLAVGIDLAVGIGLMSGALFVVPYLGTVVGVVLGCVLALLKFGLSWQILGVIAVFSVAQLIEGYILTPRIVGDKVGLHPLVVMIALIVGGSLLGIWGMLLAIPITAVASVLGAEWLESYRASRTFRAG